MDMDFMGKPGTVDNKTYYQKSATDFGLLLTIGTGGDAANTTNTGPKGGYVNNNLTSSTYTSPSVFARSDLVPGGGGLGSNSFGAHGRVIINW